MNEIHYNMISKQMFKFNFITAKTQKFKLYVKNNHTKKYKHTQKEFFAIDYPEK